MFAAHKLLKTEVWESWHVRSTLIINMHYSRNDKVWDDINVTLNRNDKV
jgi:hypothetical protein